MTTQRQKVKDLIYTIVKSIDPTINIEDYFEFKIGINQSYIDDCLVGKKIIQILESSFII